MRILYYLSLFSMIVGLVMGYFYREVTKNFTWDTVLGAVHGHVFTLGMMWYLLLLLLDDRFHLSKQKYWKSFLWIYTIGLIITIKMMVIRGLIEVTMMTLTKAQDHMIAGFAGIGHVLLTIGFILFFINLSKALSSKEGNIPKTSQKS